ncbi:hypothetical protein [Helicobacter sp. 16-1353]|uniref:hypothetical protein n=1 Tax=Helicobacter sp. 16-1353 TaxID=2004996 RepID=UPI0015EFBA36|nr:hypothetical protein [Helicobacter sp. 16-1353]
MGIFGDLDSHLDSLNLLNLWRFIKLDSRYSLDSAGIIDSLNLGNLYILDSLMYKFGF